MEAEAVYVSKYMYQKRRSCTWASYYATTDNWPRFLRPTLRTKSDKRQAGSFIGRLDVS